MGPSGTGRVRHGVPPVELPIESGGRARAATKRRHRERPGKGVAASVAFAASSRPRKDPRARVLGQGLPCPDSSFTPYEEAEPPPVRVTLTWTDWPGFSTPPGRYSR